MKKLAPQNDPNPVDQNKNSMKNFKTSVPWQPRYEGASLLITKKYFLVSTEIGNFGRNFAKQN